MQATIDLGMKTAPRHQHTGCTACVFLGHQDKHDLYVCLREDTLIARWGEAGEYYSGKDFGFGSNPWLTEARRRAQARGLIKYDLRAAVRHTVNGANAADLKELQDAIMASAEGRAMMMCDRNPDEGLRRLAVLAEAQALAWQAQFPDKKLEDLRGWYRSHLLVLHHRMVQLGLPVDTRGDGYGHLPDETTNVGILLEEEEA